MRDEIKTFANLGPLPDQDASFIEIQTYEDLLHSISKPITNEEARTLVNLFGPDECYGLAWTLLHLIETAPDWPLDDCLPEDGNDWHQIMRKRIENAKKHK